MDELAQIRQKKLLELKKRLELKKETLKRKKQMDAKVQQILASILTQSALVFLSSLMEKNRATCEKIKNLLVSAYLAGLITFKLDVIDLKLLQRKIEGAEPNIWIKRRGHAPIKLK